MIPLSDKDIISPYNEDGNLNKQGEELFNEGVKVLTGGRKLGVVILSGGEGTRLGLTYPKGLFQIEGATLFEWHLKRLQCLYEKYKCELYLFIMTSDSTDKQVKEFFANKNYTFIKGIEIFKQSGIEALDMKTRQSLCRDGKVIMNPVGNGDFFDAIKKAQLRTKVEAFNVISVDNVLANILDEVYVGAFYKYNFETLSKAVKAMPNESVGAFFRDGEHIKIEEYSEAKARNGNNVYGNICNHLFTRAFVERVSEQKLPLHEAFKKIPFTNEKGMLVKPASPNGIKREKFIFDSFEFTTKNGVLSVPRNHEFSPLKNSAESPADNPVTCAAAIKNYRLKSNYKLKSKSKVATAKV
ncbi:uncharacterized protein VICG_01340 [Vittaforma corneae ATCC 50505]|uniref:UDP-N-acetylglucosamine diphosphorylase n=1 Tax=Vittaforma corneae (strain ATCC 50505) TaxID=993615 RepID=L2GMS3_VITCO|nr:uncharacterized protein VICG_01340 [Vittaforma corneae ATCC 50505]ELA41592.1 hypothetical protein VICG_01340 [Vittaforma corneae ATCC 50505]